jgi:predicted transcriptional regulator
MRTAVKEETIQLIERMPDDCTVEDILYELYLKQKVDKGLQDIREGRVVKHQEAKQRISRWSQEVI